MGGNLAKVPVVGICYAALLWYAAAFLPRSEALAASMAEFTVPVSGLLMLLICAVVSAAAFAVVFSAARGGCVMLLAVMVVCALGLQFAVPSLRQFLLGDPSGIMTRQDLLFQLAGAAAAAILALVLCLLLMKPAQPAKEGKNLQHEPQFRLAKLGLAIRLLVLPVIFCILYYLVWYHVFWRVDAAREFYGVGEREPFMATVVAILIERGQEVLITLLIGLLYAAFGVLLLTRMRGKRILYIAANTLLSITGALWYLVPSPVMSISVRYAHLIETGALLLGYGILSSLLLYTVFRRVEAPAARPASPPQSAAGRPAQPARAGGATGR